MKIKQKVESAKSWTQENFDLIVYGGIIAASFGMFALIVKQQNDAVRDYNESVKNAYTQAQEAIQRGATVLPSPAGFWIIEKD